MIPVVSLSDKVMKWVECSLFLFCGLYTVTKYVLENENKRLLIFSKQFSLENECVTLNTITCFKNMQLQK